MSTILAPEHERDSKTEISAILSTFSENIRHYIRDFLEQSTLHGLRYTIIRNNNYIDVVLWIITITLSLGGAWSLIQGSWQRFNDNPTVVSLEKDYRLWNTSFPSATMCFERRMDEQKAHKEIIRIWGENDTESPRYSRLLAFIGNVSSLTYHTLGSMEDFVNDPDVQNVDLVDIAHRVHPALFFRATVFDTDNRINFTETMTEMGICFGYSAVMARYLPIKKNTPVIPFDPPQCNFLNSLCYARVEDLPGPVKYYVHSPYDIPDITTPEFTVHSRQERDTTVRFLETVASTQLRRLSVAQRRCVFFDEPVLPVGVYSYNLCKMDCRRRLAIGLCGCVPIFYASFPSSPGSDVIGSRGDIGSGHHEVCGVRGMACLAPFQEDIISISVGKVRVGKVTIDCKCYHSCQEIRYFTDRNAERSWAYPVPDNIRFRWAIELYSKTRLKRDVLFTFEDLLVSFGGTAALFLGCSILSGVELIYFFSLRLLCFLTKKAKRQLSQKN